MPGPVITRALVARLVDYGEADRVCTLICEGPGKVSALARGARSSRRRFGGALGPFVLGEAALKTPRRGELWSVERFESLEDLGRGIAGDVVKLAHGSYVLELARELSPPGVPEPEVFALVLEVLRAFEGRPPSPTLLRCYELRLLEALGVAPELEACTVCGGAAEEEPVAFSLRQGGVVCGRCSGEGLQVPGAALSLLRALRRAPAEAAARLQPEASAARGARELMLHVVRQHLTGELKSLAFITQLAGR
ncbi:MAG: DNA repair protein RecO [Deltaproteobacteria bacterium]|nr:DNA repair protein RecO [Deltaproteobacteria bacterium]